MLCLKISIINPVTDTTATLDRLTDQDIAGQWQGLVRAALRALTMQIRDIGTVPEGAGPMVCLELFKDSTSGNSSRQLVKTSPGRSA